MTEVGEIEQKINDALAGVKIIDTHEHFSDNTAILNEGADLFSILPRGYVGFFDFYPGLKSNLLQFSKYPEIHDRHFPALKQFVNDYNVHEFLDVLDIGIRHLHGASIKHMTEGTFERLNNSIAERYADPHYRDDTMRRMHIQRAICDVPTHVGGLSPGFRHEFPAALYSPAMRINSLLFGFDPGAWSPGTCLMRLMVDELKLLPGMPSTFEGFLDSTDKILAWSRGKIASFKCASAYERTIDFGTRQDAAPGSRKFKMAKTTFGKPFNKVPEQDRLAFGDVVMHHVLGQLEGHGVPLQMHTGTAIMPGSHPKHVEHLLAEYPRLTFSLLHCGFPWTSETIDILKKHDNARADMAWLQTLSARAARDFLERSLEQGLGSKIFAFGGDCACIEGSIGALLRVKEVAKQAITTLVNRHVIELHDMEAVLQDLFFDNPRSVFSKIVE